MAERRVIVQALNLFIFSGAIWAQAGAPPAQPNAADPAGTSSPAAVFSGAVEVTTTRIEASVLDAPVAVTIVPREQIETTPVSNVADLLRGVPGLNVIQTSARDFAVRSRGQVGVAEKSEMVLLDGRSMYLDYYGYVAWDILPVGLDEIERIEVEQGPGSALWGANAMSGVINVITRSPRELQGGRVTLAGGERGYRAGSARWARAYEAWSYTLFASYSEQDPWPRLERLPNGDPLPVGYHFENQGSEQPKADVRADYESEAGKLWSFRAGYGGSYGIFHSSIGPFLIESGSNLSSLEANYTSGLFDARAYLNRLRADAPALLSGLPARFEMETYVGELTKRFAIGEKQLVVAGANARLNRFDLSIAPLHHSQNGGGVFAAGEVQLSSTLAAYLGGRFDFFETIGTVFSPRASLVWQPRPTQSMRVSYNRSYRAPALLDNYLQVTIPGVLELGPSLPPFVFYFDAVGNPGLHEERMDSVEIGYSGRLGGRWTVTASAYANEVQENIFFHPVVYYGPDDPPAGWPLPAQFVPPGVIPKQFGYSNVGKVRNQGVELSASVDWRPGIFSRLSYTRQADPRVSDLRGTPLVINEPSPNLASFLTSVRTGPWGGSISIGYVDRAFWADVLDARFWGTTRAFTTVDLSLSRSFANNRIEWIFAATNILDRQVQQHIYGDVIGRRMSLEVRYRF